MTRSLRHPFGGGRVHPRPSKRGGTNRSRRPNRPRRAHEPRFSERKNVSVGSLVGSPEETASRPNVRLYVIGFVGVALFAVLGLRLWTLQVIDGKTYAASVTRNEVRVVSIPAPRGEIVDRDGTVLAGNQTVEELLLSQVTAQQDPSIIGSVAALVGETPVQVRQALDDSQYSPYEPVPILDNAPVSVIDYYQEHQSAYPGVSLQQVSQRTYPQNTPGVPIATSVLGYISSITTAQLKANPDAGYLQGSQFGQSGLENQYEPYLRGTAGRQALAVNAAGHVVGTLSATDPVPGDTVVTNIDLGLQEAVQSALQSDITADRHTVDKTTGKLPTANDGAAVVLDAQTGAVLAMASYPTYDPSEWTGGISHANYAALSAGCNTTSATTGCPLINYAIAGLYTPGSTFKLNTATAALNDGIINAGTYVDDTGTYTVKNCTADCTFHDDEAADAGEIDLQDALTESDDYYFYNLGDLFYTSSNPTGIQQTASAYGLGHQTGIDLPGEAAGQVDSAALREGQHKEDASAFPNPGYLTGDNIEMAFGQGETLVTPIQNALAYATFANGGTRYQPQVAAAIVSPDGQVVKQFAPKVTVTVSLPPSTYGPMLAGFEGVVDSTGGTAYLPFHQDAHFPLNTYPIAGKTGTADVARGLEPNAWFVGFGPLNHATNQPEYVVAVVVDHGGYGAQAAAPAVADIFNYLYANPVGPVQLPTATRPPTATPASTVPPAGTPTTTTTSTASTSTTSTTATTTTAPR
jgi:penicillin-binding protein 2